MMGYIVFLWGSVITFKSARLKYTTLSSCESESCAATHAAVEIKALREKAKFCNIEVPDATTLYCDNMATIQLSVANASGKRLKHIASRIAFLQEYVKNKILTLLHISTQGQLADIFTKPLGAAAFHVLRPFLVH